MIKILLRIIYENFMVKNLLIKLSTKDDDGLTYGKY